jgi:hypothetical protein
MTETWRLQAAATWRLQAAALGGFVLVLLYSFYYLTDPSAPGNQLDPADGTAWIYWGDQGLYYRSARALAAGDLDPHQHWYPLGYAALAAPFVFLANHQFFVVDLLALIVAYASFIQFALRVGVSEGLAALLFLATSCLDTMLFRQWAIPWNTTPAAAVIWAMLAVSAAYLKGDRRPLLLGLLAGALPLIRPTDGIVSAICLGWVGVDALRRRPTARDAVRAAAGVLLAVVPYAALHLGIYGLHATQYMLNSRAIGFTLHNPVFRAYVLLIEPKQWFFVGYGLMQRMPWLLFGFAGALVAWRRGTAAALLSVCLIVYCLMFIAYVDLLPTGLWRYFNVHYFKWTLPGFGLLGWLLARDLLAKRRLSWAALAIVFLISCIRVSPRPADPGEPAVAVDLHGALASEGSSTLASSLLARDAAGPLPNITVMRALPLPLDGGVRLIAVRRDFVGTVTWAPERGLPMAADGMPQLRWAERIGFGYPCWLPPKLCNRRVPGN